MLVRYKLIPFLFIGMAYSVDCGFVRASKDPNAPVENSWDTTFFEWIKSKNSKDFRAIHLNYIEKYRDITINPCENFYQYACNNWPYSGKGTTSIYESKQFQHERINKLLKSLIMSDVKSDDSEIVIKMKNFYRSCVNLDEIDAQKMRPLSEFMIDMGSWPIFDPNWSNNNFNWESMVAKARFFAVHIFIRQFISHKITNQTEDRYYMDLDRDRLYTPQIFEYGIKYYKDFLSNNLLHMELTGISAHYLEDMLSRIVEFHEKLFGIPYIDGELQVIDFITLRESAPLINWQEYFSVLLGRPMNPREPVMVRDLNYFAKLGELIAETDPKTVADYIFMRITGGLWKYVDPSRDLNRLDYCFSKVKDIMDLSLSNYFAKHFFSAYKQNEMLSIVEDIRTILNKTIHCNSWLRKETKEKAIKKLNDIIAHVGYTDLNNDEDVERIYSDVHMNPNQFFANIVQIYPLNVQSGLILIGQRIDESSSTQETYERWGRFHGKDIIILPAGLLQPPFYHEFIPRSINYGAIGHAIGDTMLSALDLVRRKTVDDSKDVWYSKADQKKLNQIFECFESQYNKKNNLLKFIRETEVLKMAFGAYKNWTENHVDFIKSEFKDYARLNLTNAKLFYLVYAQNQCVDMENPHISTDTMKRVNGAISNNREFAKVFNCPLGAPMNPKSKCSFIF